MKIGFLGLGKLGLPCALAMEEKGHEIAGYDPLPQVQAIVKARKIPYLEEGAQAALEKSNIRVVSPAELVASSELIFVAVQTPHAPEFEGATPMPAVERRDFDYSYLESAIETLCQEIAKRKKPSVVVVISTVLPGTMRTRVYPIIRRHRVESHLLLCYNPFFIAMGTAMRDFLNPEFVLFGVDSKAAAERAKKFYSSIHNKPVYETTIENAELIKVAYNTFIGMKIVFANTVMEICHKTPGTSIDAVMSAINLGTERLISPKYLNGGMGDGGGCHPRDNIALSWLARELHLSHNFFDDIMMAREDQTRWLSDLIVEAHRESGLPIVLLGLSFKENTNLTVGSPARLLSHYLSQRGYKHVIHDPYATPDTPAPTTPSVFFVSTKHEDWKKFDFPKGSMVIDPWRYLSKNNSISHSKYIPIGSVQ